MGLAGLYTPELQTENYNIITYVGPRQDYYSQSSIKKKFTSFSKATVVTIPNDSDQSYLCENKTRTTKSNRTTHAHTHTHTDKDKHTAQTHAHKTNKQAEIGRAHV